jgi:hypothetical protein
MVLDLFIPMSHSQASVTGLVSSLAGRELHPAFEPVFSITTLACGEEGTSCGEPPII